MFFSIVTVTYKDAWACSKTTRSVFRQSYKDFEYIIVDGNSYDGTEGLGKFWDDIGLVDQYICEPDAGVYDAMNKGARLATGEYVCFLNAGDVFSNDLTLQRVHDFLTNRNVDGCLGWGELNDRVWASWCESEAIKLSSLGFCHQALFVKRQRLLENPFDDRSFKTDSDTLQLGRFYESDAKIPIVPEVWAVRGAEPGISADLERSKVSIINTLMEEYKVTEEQADLIIRFRRRGDDPDKIIKLMESSKDPLKDAIARMIMDTLFQWPSKAMNSERVEDLRSKAVEHMSPIGDLGVSEQTNQLIVAQKKRSEIMNAKRNANHALVKDINKFRDQEARRVRGLVDARGEATWVSPREYVISLTSFPARIKTLQFVIQSLIEQSYPPAEIHLNIGSDEIPNENWLSPDLLKFKDRGLVINFVPQTFHQYDKFIHNAHLNKDKPFVIVDDDVIYPEHSMKTLIDSHILFPDAVIANRGHLMNVDDDGELGPYADWAREQNFHRPSLALMPTGAGGVLYPIGFLTDDIVTDVDTILANAPYADDIWLKAVALMRGIPTFNTELSSGSLWYHRYTPTMEAGTLMATNVELGLNDLQVSRCTAWLDEKRPDWRGELFEDLEDLKREG